MNLKDIVKQLEEAVEKPIEDMEVVNESLTIAKNIQSCRPDKVDGESVVEKICSEKIDIDAEEIQQNFHKFIFTSRFLDITLNNIINYMNGHKIKGEFASLVETVNYIEVQGLEHHVTDLNLHWKTPLKEKIQKSSRGKNFFDKYRYTTDCHCIDNFEEVIDYLFGDKDIEDAHERWIKTKHKGNKISIYNYELQGILYFATNNAMNKGPNPLSRNYILSERLENIRNRKPSINTRIRIFTVERKIQDYRKYNKKYLDWIICTQYKSKKKDMQELFNYPIDPLNSKGCPARKEILKKIKDNEKGVLYFKLTRVITKKKVSMMLKLLEQKGLITITRKKGYVNVIGIGKCNPYYQQYREKWKKLWI